MNPGNLPQSDGTDEYGESTPIGRNRMRRTEPMNQTEPINWTGNLPRPGNLPQSDVTAESGESTPIGL